MLKYCTKCKIEKGNSEFYDYERNKNKLCSWCK